MNLFIFLGQRKYNFFQNFFLLGKPFKPHNAFAKIHRYFMIHKSKHENM